MRSVHPELTGPDVYRVARALKSLFQQSLELVHGGADQQSEGIQVVACPVARNLVPLASKPFIDRGCVAPWAESHSVFVGANSFSQPWRIVFGRFRSTSWRAPLGLQVSSS